MDWLSVSVRVSQLLPVEKPPPAKIIHTAVVENQTIAVIIASS
jgi:hypothetical protein